jgi:ABC-2 type transport system ATP-binding protein
LAGVILTAAWPGRKSLIILQRLTLRAMSAVEIDRLTVHRGGREVLHGVSASLAEGQVTGLFGPSGSGKSTLIRAIAGVQAHVVGTLTVLGAAPGSARARAQLGYKTQAPSVYEDLTVAENLRYFASVRGARAGGGLLARVGLADCAGQLVRNLSGGQAARVSLAAALVGDPRLVLLDEPTVGLDPLLRRELWQLFGELAREGAALLVSSHVLDEARHCDQLLLMREGRILAQMAPARLIAATSTEDMDEAFVRLIERG